MVVFYRIAATVNFETTQKKSHCQSNVTHRWCNFHRHWTLTWHKSLQVHLVVVCTVWVFLAPEVIFVTPSTNSSGVKFLQMVYISPENNTLSFIMCIKGRIDRSLGIYLWITLESELLLMFDIYSICENISVEAFQPLYIKLYIEGVSLLKSAERHLNMFIVVFYWLAPTINFNAK